MAAEIIEQEQPLLQRLRNYLGLVGAYTAFNLKSQWAYRGAFISQMFAMAANNCVWVAFWALFFERFPVLRGWGVKDVITLWAIAATGFGIAHTVCGNALALPWLIARGQLDVWMLYPRALLSHVLLGRMSATACGDTVFGFAVYVLFVRPDLPHFCLFVALSFAVAFLFVGFSILTGSLTFFLGNAEGLAEQWRFSMITFSTYPATLFEGVVKIILYTLIPAAFVSYLPIEALREMSLYYSLLTVLGALAVLLVGVLVFYLGLRRYESGNLTEMRG
ncbi:MAG: ABC transporter permease [Candidatus Obscuribacterales bacterium]